MIELSVTTQTASFEPRMTQAQSAAAMQYYFGSAHPKQAAEAPLFEAFDIDFRAHPERLRELLDETLASRQADDVESLLGIADQFGALTHEGVPVLCRLMLADFHQRHEDIARYLQSLRDPGSVEALFEACFIQLPYFWDDGDALARKCTWALHDVGTPEAFERLRALTDHPRPSVIGYARKRLPADTQM